MRLRYHIHLYGVRKGECKGEAHDKKGAQEPPECVGCIENGWSKKTQNGRETKGRKKEGGLQGCRKAQRSFMAPGESDSMQTTRQAARALGVEAGWRGVSGTTLSPVVNTPIY